MEELGIEYGVNPDRPEKPPAHTDGC